MMNQKGMIDLMLIAVLVVLLAAGAFTMWRIQEADKTVTNTDEKLSYSANENGIQSPETKYELDFSLWEKSGEEPDIEDVTSEYSEKNGTGSLAIYKSNPRIWYSSNAPVYCRYEDGQWVHYSAIESGNNDYKADDDEYGACAKIEESTDDSGLTYFSRFGGALGQTTYRSAVKVNDEWLIFSDYYNYEPDFNNNNSTSDEEFEKLNDDLRESLEEKIEKTIIIKT
jgi:uncharacterized protein YxeA